MKRITWTERLAPFAGHFQAMYADITITPDDELKAIEGACQRATEYNCGWSTYAAAKHLLPEIRAERRRRKIAARDKRRVQPGDSKP